MSGVAAAPSLDPLIAEARRRARRRRGAVALLVTAAVGGAWLVTRGGARRAGLPALPPLQMTRDPYIGVACPAAPNSIACDRVGVAVWLRHPAHSVTATLAGRSITLLRRGGASYYSGYLRHAGLIDGALKIAPDGGRLHWTGVHPRWAALTIRARGYAPARRVVQLSPGWG